MMWLPQSSSSARQDHACAVNGRFAPRRSGALSGAAGGMLVAGMAMALGAADVSAAAMHTAKQNVAVSAASLAQAKGPQAAAASDKSVLSLLAVAPPVPVPAQLPPTQAGLSARPADVLSLNDSVLMALCRIRFSQCASPANAPHTHEWAGHVVGDLNLNRAVATHAGGELSAAGPLLLSMPEYGTYAGQIAGNLHSTLARAGVPAALSAQLEKSAAGRLAAKRSARPGDYYRIVYERSANGLTGATRDRITAFEIRLGGKTFQAVWFAPPGRTDGDYYSFEGRKLAAEPFAMPVRYMRVSSPFGYRIHPVSGERLFHTGVDLTAPVGTPVAAAAAGTVAAISFEKGYGKHVVIRHADGYTSYYAHLSSFAKGLRVGAHIDEGQVIGAVGMTGVATGAHLHFEVRIANRPVDPLKLTSRFGPQTLAKSQRASFDVAASVARVQLMALQTGGVRTASSNSVMAR